ncbi:MAG: LPS export ABC transporter periplasmic protein LptC [Marinosulfonomonas sp.]|nr:LPS export ABC transporter periplasmic protein LptC [Marinosulfonomonas sp.]
MFASDNSYSRLILSLKITLPLLALAILSTLFLVAKSLNPAQSIPFAKVDVQELSRAQGIGNPAYSGMSLGGSAITVTADKAVPDSGGSQDLTASNLRAVVQSPDGFKTEITATVARIENSTKTAQLSDGIKISTSTGYSVVTDNAFARLDLSELSTGGTVTADGPMGLVTAGQMVMTQQFHDGGDNGYVLVFKNGVNLIYTP